jgi:hypothetical protein
LSDILDNRIGTASGVALDVVTARFFFTSDVPSQLMTAGIQWLWRAIAVLGASGGAALRGFGAGTVGNTAPRRVAKRNRLGRHRPHLRRCLSDKRRTITELEAPSCGRMSFIVHGDRLSEPDRNRR